MMSRRQRNMILGAKWAVYFLLLMLAATLQTTPGFLAIGEMRPIFILPLCIAVAAYEGEFAGALFGAAGGLLWDFTSGRIAGILALGLLAVCFFTAILVQLYLRISATNMILTTGAASLWISGIDFLFYYLMPGYAGAADRYFSVVLPEVVFTAVLSPLALYLVQRVWKRLTVED